MATFFRAAVMLTVLVGLPSAWVYYGPLPPEAMGVIQRTVASAKKSIGWEDRVQSTSWMADSPKTAPRFDASLAQATQLLQQSPEQDAASVPTPMIQDSRFSLASASGPHPGVSQQQISPQGQSQTVANIDPSLASKLEPHLSLLRSLDAADYTLENWGGDGQMYRFRCAVSLGANDDHTRQFEAIDANPLRAVHTVVGEVTAWQNTRHTGASTRWR